jgi:hypothetical protein
MAEQHAGDRVAHLGLAGLGVAAQGRLLIVVLQPNLFIQASPTDYERSLSELCGEGFRRAVLEDYGLFDPVVRRSPNHIVATEAMDALQPSPYLDWMHVTSSGNECVAEVVAGFVADLLAGN